MAAFDAKLAGAAKSDADMGDAEASRTQETLDSSWDICQSKFKCKYNLWFALEEAQ